LARNDLGVDPADPLAVEDSPNGITAAKAAGLFCVAVLNPMTSAFP
jgi:HAD superfamily hydrolase (TIGR01509 family)